MGVGDGRLTGWERDLKRQKSAEGDDAEGKIRGKRWNWPTQSLMLDLRSYRIMWIDTLVFQ
jgi:hypothetical protein